ncbi:hypothetical protein F8M41_005875 [Gigaspora margarita]|uniref:Uncharacterized protein n=1 Tax=Gigaspora margarita TaxID=4874 RepID=A0A8H3X7D9_GIGMA|nr:hypothetical protein F8M41_005875 [Gigaspora margarita]
MGNQHSEHRNDDSSYEKSGSSYTSNVAAKWGTCPECKGPNTGWNWCQHSEIQIHSKYDDPSYIANWFGISQDPLNTKMHPEITTAEYVKYFADINDNNKSNEIE